MATPRKQRIEKRTMNRQARETKRLANRSERETKRYESRRESTVKSGARLEKRGDTLAKRAGMRSHAAVSKSVRKSGEVGRGPAQGYRYKEEKANLMRSTGAKMQQEPERFMKNRRPNMSVQKKAPAGGMSGRYINRKGKLMKRK